MRRVHTLSGLVIALFTLAACNSITGANKLTIGDVGGGDGQGGAGTSGAGDTTNGVGPATTTGVGSGGAQTTTTGTGNATTTTTTTGTGDPTTTTGSGNPVGGDAQGVSISEIAIYQGTKIDLEKGGAPSNAPVPVVAGRDALVRVFVTTDGTYNGQPVTASITINGQTFSGQGTAQASNDASLSSTLNIDVPGSGIPAGGTFSVALTQPTSVTQNPAAHYPASGTASLGSESTGAQMKVTIVPIQYGADGSNRVPDTSAAGLQPIHDRYLAIYATPAVNITVRAPYPWSQAVDASGNGWDELLSAITDLRAQDGAANDVYYYGMFLPSSDVNSFCGGGCVAGLGNIADAGDSSQQAAIGLGYPEFSAETAAHETGHNHGRMHANCGGAQGIDPNYPYAGASIGNWGYDIINKVLYSPSNTTDMMGYCDPTWASDYTYKALLDRIKLVNGAQMIYPADLLNRTYLKVRVDGQGGMRWSTHAITLHDPPIGTKMRALVETSSGVHEAYGSYFALDHLEGGFVYFAEDFQDVKSITMSFNGQSYKLSK